MEYVVFDIETGPLPDNELEPLAPPFDRGKVKGVEILEKEYEPKVDKRIKKAEIIAERIERGRIKFAEDVAKMVQKVEDARIKQFSKFRDGAALKAETGKVLAIGYFNNRIQIDGRCEQDQLLKFWDVASEVTDRGNRMIGFNIFGQRFQPNSEKDIRFGDLPFIVRRSWILGLSFPLEKFFDGHYWSRTFVDILEVWRVGRYGDLISLDRLAKALKVGSKPDGISGKDFARLWEENRNQAKAYLANDLKMTRACAERLGCLIS